MSLAPGPVNILVSKTNCNIWLATDALRLQTPSTVAQEFSDQVCTTLLPFLACNFNLPTFQGSHVIAMILLMFAPGWWADHFKPVINPMPLADIRNPPNLDPPPLFGPAVKRGRGDQLESDTDECEVFAQLIFHMRFTSN